MGAAAGQPASESQACPPELAGRKALQSGLGGTGLPSTESPAGHFVPSKAPFLLRMITLRRVLPTLFDLCWCAEETVG